MPLLVTSASGATGIGFGALLAFDLNGRLRGTFIDDDRVADPRGLAVDPNEHLLFLNSGADRVLAISAQGRVVRDTGWIEGLNPGGANFGPDYLYCVGLRGRRTIIALATNLDVPAGGHRASAAVKWTGRGAVPVTRGSKYRHDVDQLTSLACLTAVFVAFCRTGTGSQIATTLEGSRRWADWLGKSLCGVVVAG